MPIFKKILKLKTLLNIFDFFMKTLVLFGSSTGNTEELAGTVYNVLLENGQDVELVNIAENTAINYSQYDYLFLGSSTWDEGQVQLDFRFYLEDLQSNPPDLNGKKFVVFGTGESCYPHFCGGIDKLEVAFAAFGANKIYDSLKIDTLEEDPVENERVVEWAKAVLEKNKA